MNTRTLTRRVEENDVNEEIPPHVEQVEQVSHGDQVPNVGRGQDFSVVPSEILVRILERI